MKKNTALFLCRLGCFLLVVLSCLLSFSSCSHPRLEDSYVGTYSYLQKIRELKNEKVRLNTLPEAFIIIHVDAAHLNYRTFETFIGSMQRGLLFNRDPQIGHAWITVSFLEPDGSRVYYEVGHTGELGLTAPKYFDEVIFRALNGKDLNPVRYLYASLPDGLRENSSGMHIPTLSALIPISLDSVQAWQRLTFESDGYDFQRWALQDHNCITYVQASLAACNIELELQETIIDIPKVTDFQGATLVLWNDSRYRFFSCKTVDSLEKWLFQEIQKGKAAYISSSQIAKWHSEWKKIES